jgi:hypothetical protein
MPTGYTSKLYNGEQSFYDFATYCMRQFGACVSLRDSGSCDIPDKIVKNDYYIKQAETMREELDLFKKLSRSEVQKLIDSEYDREIARAQTILSEIKARKARWEVMTDQVRQWEPPTPQHIEFKGFMLQQLDTEHFDWEETYYGNIVNNRQKPTIDKYILDTINQQEGQIKSYLADDAREDASVAKANKWISDIRDSLIKYCAVDF